MARIPYKDLDQVSAPLRELIDSRRPLNLYRMLAHGGAAAEGFLALGSALLRNNSLETQLRELVILRVGILSNAEYEVFQHTRLARKSGIPEEKIDALRDGPDAAVFSEQEQTLLRYTDTVVLNVKAGDTAFRHVRALLDKQQLVELHLLIGFYMLVCRFLENFEIDLEDSLAGT